MKEKRTKARSGAAELPLGLVASDLVTPSALRTTGLVYPGSLNPIAGCVRNHSHGYESSAPHSRHSSALPLVENSGRKQAEPRQIRKQKVINTSRARGLDVDGLYISNSSPLRPRVRAKERLLCTWREAVKATDYALEHFGDRERDRGIWIWYCRRIGLDTFLDIVDEVISSARQGELRWPARALQRHLQEALPKEGLPSVAAAKEGGRHV